MITKFNKFENKDATNELVVYMLYLIDEIYINKRKYLLPDVGKVIVLLNRGADKNAHDTNNYYGSLLSMSVFIKSLELVQLLVEHKVDIDSQNNIGASPIYIAANLGYLKILEYLHKNDANINNVNDSDISPLRTAIFNKRWDCACYLLDNNADINNLINNLKNIKCENYQFQKLFMELYPYDFINLFDDRYISKKIKDEYEYIWSAKNFNL